MQLLLLMAPAAIAFMAHAQGGPPFITDDPGTPGNRHWEINLGWIADHNPGLAYYQLPDIDMNYGWGDRIQLKYELPWRRPPTRTIPRAPGWASRCWASNGGPTSIIAPGKPSPTII